MSSTRYKITIPEGVLRMYYHNIEEAQANFPGCPIEEDNDTSYLEYVEKIKAKCYVVDNDVWIMPYHGGHIYYRQYQEDGQYLDGCQYKENFTHRFIMPVMWTLTTPKAFWELFFVDEVTDSEYKRLSKREFNKLKPKPYKLTKNFYADDNGRFYEVNSFFWSKRLITEWEQFHEDEDPVILKVYGLGYCDDASLKHKWCHNEEEAKQIFADYIKDRSGHQSTLYLTYIHKKYPKLHPYDRKNVIRLPYIPIQTMYKQGNSAQQILSTWYKRMKGCYYFKDVCDRQSWDDLETALKKYLEKNSKSC